MRPSGSPHPFVSEGTHTRILGYEKRSIRHASRNTTGSVRNSIDGSDAKIREMGHRSAKHRNRTDSSVSVYSSTVRRTGGKLIRTIKDGEDMFSLRTINLILKEKKPVVLILKGLPGSGKSTISKSLIESVPNTVIVSKDTIRKELWEASSPDAKTIKWKKNCSDIKDRPSERLVCETRDKKILEAIANGNHVIVDDTNLNPVHIEQIKNIIADKAIIEEVFINTPVQECIKRDKSRPEDQQVGPMVIWSMYNRYLKSKEEENGNATDGRLCRIHETNDETRRQTIRSDCPAIRGTEERVGRMPANAKGSKYDNRRSTSTKGSSLGTDQTGTGPSRQREGNAKDRGRNTLGNNRHTEGTVTVSSGTTDAARGIAKNRLGFDTATDRLLKWRQSIIGSEDKHGWARNSRGMWEFSWDAPCYNLNGQFVGILKIYYADQNPKGRSYEARMVSSKKWKETDAGWLWTIFGGQRIWLGKATPSITKSVHDGYIIDGKDGKEHIFLNL